MRARTVNFARSAGGARLQQEEREEEEDEDGGRPRLHPLHRVVQRAVAAAERERRPEHRDEHRDEHRLQPAAHRHREQRGEDDLLERVAVRELPRVLPLDEVVVPDARVREAGDERRLVADVAVDVGVVVELALAYSEQALAKICLQIRLVRVQHVALRPSRAKLRSVLPAHCLFSVLLRRRFSLL